MNLTLYDRGRDILDHTLKNIIIRAHPLLRVFLSGPRLSCIRLTDLLSPIDLGFREVRGDTAFRILATLSCVVNTELNHNIIIPRKFSPPLMSLPAFIQ